jgi:pyruvate formate lyase activating enzyme
MKIGGLLRNSWIDFPGLVSCVVFTPGCNFRCPYCHNPHLVTGPLPEGVPDENEVLAFLDRRRGLLDGVVVSGGEPTLRKGLVSFCTKVKALGFKVKLDTNGSGPDSVAALLSRGLVDYVAMDIKSDLPGYPALAGPGFDPGALERSIGLIMDRAPDYEFRTTCVRPFVDREIVARIAGMIRGARRYILQGCSLRGSLLDPGLLVAGSGVMTPDEILALRAVAEGSVETCIVR